MSVLTDIMGFGIEDERLCNKLIETAKKMGVDMDSVAETASEYDSLNNSNTVFYALFFEVASKVLNTALKIASDNNSPDSGVIDYINDMLDSNRPSISLNSICTQYDDEVFPGFYPDSTLDEMVNDLISNINDIIKRRAI